MKSHSTVCHWERRPSNEDKTAEASVPAKCSLLPTWCVGEKGGNREHLQLPRSLNFSQAASSSLKDSEEHEGLHSPCDCCFFVHPSLLIPLLPQASAFTNPCWPPTPSKKKRGLHNSSKTYRAVCSDMSEAPSECKVKLSIQSVFGNQPHTPHPGFASAQCTLRAFAQGVASNNTFFSPTQNVPCVHPCKACVRDQQEQRRSPVPNLLDGEHERRSSEKHGRERRKHSCFQQAACSSIKRPECLIGKGQVLLCACCSPWLRSPSRKLAKKTDESGDRQTVCPTSRLECVNFRDGHNEAAYTSTASAQGREESVVANYRTKRRISCYRAFRDVVEAASVSAEKCEEECVKSLLHGTALSIQRQPPACDLAGNEYAKKPAISSGLMPSHFSGDAHQVEEATESQPASRKASSGVIVEGLPKGKARAGALTEADATLRCRGYASVEALLGRRITQGISADTSGCLQEGQTPHTLSQSSFAAHTVTRDTSETKRKAYRDALEHMRRPRGTPDVPLRSTVPAAQSSRVQYDHSSTSAGPALCFSALCQDSSCTRPSGSNGSILLPSIGCGLSVAQSSLGKGSGLGVYAMRPFCARSRITEYSGLCVDRKVALLLRSMGTSTHVMRVGMQHQYLVGYRLPFLYGGAGAFVNDGRWYADGRRGPGVSARLQVVYDKKRARDRVYVVATRNIAAGEEIFTSYDNLYWALME